jgi:hypothetical protein
LKEAVHYNIFCFISDCSFPIWVSNWKKVQNL